MGLLAKIKGFFIKQALKRVLGGKSMEPIFKWLEGKKSYIISAVAVVLGGLELSGVKVPDGVYVILGGLLGVSMRDAVAKIKQ